MSGLGGLLRRTGLAYLDLLYAHRFDAATPLEETTTALTHAVQQGKHGLGCIATDSTGHARLNCSAGRARRTKGMRRGRPRGLAQIAAVREQSMEQLALSWVLRDPAITSVLTPAVHSHHLENYGDAAHQTRFTPEELAELDACFPRFMPPPISQAMTPHHPCGSIFTPVGDG
ncbi:aldo/keto reductase [Streptomyces sp. NPDC006283]|uniref:aldo/keto reductase n=1 Tax=Streptomyces sp. NPDC006283 TaxID=3156741 RepID=UPI0033B090A7